MFLAFRSFAYTCFFFGWTAFMLLILWLFMPFPRPAMQYALSYWGRGNRFGLRWIVGLKYEIRGQKYMPDGPAIVACKHQSTWETMLFHAILPDPVFVFKKELMSIPLWGMYARKVDTVVVDRNAGASALKNMVREASAVFARGCSLVLFPEGTRRGPDDPPAYQRGIVALYSQCKVPVVPVALNSGVFWGRRTFRKFPGTVVVEFLPPIEPGLKRNDFLAVLEERIETASNRLRDEARQTYQLPPPETPTETPADNA